MVSDNQMCISLKDHSWINKVLQSLPNSLSALLSNSPSIHPQGATSNVHMKRIVCDGNDVLDVHRASEAAMQYARKRGRPVLLLVQSLNRRFGHGEHGGLVSCCLLFVSLTSSLPYQRPLTVSWRT
jgi:hypothetical protein